MLYVCATPIGNLGDLTPRVADALGRVELIAAEDTRHTRKLLSHLGLHVPLTSLFKHNEAQKTEEVLACLREGRDIALVSDAGMPGVQDPGMRLVTRAIAEGLEVTVLPGPSAVLTALVAAGLDGEGFRFVGYLPRRARELEAALAAWRHVGGLLVAFDTGQRLSGSLAVLAAHAPGLRAAVCRELTKLHEEIVRGTAGELAERYAAEPVRGEVVLVIGPAAAGAADRAAAVEAVLRLVEAGARPRAAATVVARLTGLSANDLYGGAVTGEV